MKDGFYKAVIHGWLEFFKYENGQPFGLETGKKNSWYPTLVSRESLLEAVTMEDAKSQYPEFVTKNQKASVEDIFGSIKSGFAASRMGLTEVKLATFLSKLEKLVEGFDEFAQAEIEEFSGFSDERQTRVVRLVADVYDSVRNACTVEELSYGLR